MEPSPQRLVLVLLLGFTLGSQALEYGKYCQGICPGYTLIHDNGHYEEREYEESVWMCTHLEGTAFGQVTAANRRLNSYRKQQSEDIGEDIDPNTWPGLFSQKQVGSGGFEYKMCWYIPPGLTLSDTSEVTVTTFPKATMLVRGFGGTPSVALGESNAMLLKQDLEAADESFDESIHYGVGYESFFSLAHHNEIWIPKD